MKIRNRIGLNPSKVSVDREYWGEIKYLREFAKISRKLRQTRSLHTIWEEPYNPRLRGAIWLASCGTLPKRQEGNSFDCEVGNSFDSSCPRYANGTLSKRKRGKSNKSLLKEGARLYGSKYVPKRPSIWKHWAVSTSSVISCILIVQRDGKFGWLSPLVT